MAYNAQFIATALGATVLAYNRRGTGTSVCNLGLRRKLHPSRIAQTTAQTGTELARIIHGSTDTSRLILAGHSAAASEVIALANTQTLPTETIAVSDPVGLRDIRLFHGISAWARYQLITQKHSPESNQHPSPDKPSLSTFVMRNVIDIANYGRFWRSTLPLAGMKRLASHPAFSKTTAYVRFVEETFSARPSALHIIAEELNSLRPPDAPQPFITHVAEGLYHNHFDDPAHTAEMIQEALQLRRPTPQEH